MFTSLLVLSVFLLFLLGAFALLFNYRQNQNQLNLLKASKIETSLFSMSNALSALLTRQSLVLSIRNVEDFGKLPPSSQIEQQFVLVLERLSAETDQNLDIKSITRSIQATFQELLQNENKIAAGSKTMLKLKSQLTEKALQVETELINLRGLSESVYGNLFLQNRKIVNQVTNEMRASNVQDKNALSTQSFNSVIELIASPSATAQRITQKLNVGFVALDALMHQLINESNSDVLNSLKGNQLLQLINLIQTNIRHLKKQLSDFPAMMEIAEAIGEKFNTISQQMVQEKDNLFDLRYDYNVNDAAVQEAVLQVQNNLITLQKDFTILSDNENQIKTEILERADKLSSNNRLGILLISSGVVLLMLTLGYYVQHTSSNAIQILTNAMKKLVKAEGGLDYRLTKTKYADLNEVIDAFNTMASDLHFTHEHLRELVELKTHDLSLANEYLAKLITELKAAKVQAEDASRIKSEFVANMSHELRTPLNAIIGYSEMLMEDAVDAGQKSTIDDLSKVIGAAKHLLSLINDVLDLSKIESGKLDLFLEDVNIPDLAKDIEMIIGQLIAKNNNTFTMTIDPELNMIFTDLVRVRQCLLNLLSNASKFTKNGKITLDIKPVLRNTEKWIQFTVSDTGIGIPAEKLNLLFQAFSQTDASTTRQYGGTGLGLYLTKTFCTMLGGEISVKSESGKGSAFTILLPTTREQMIHKQPEKSGI
jgi:signal transduction histidine kinase